MALKISLWIAVIVSFINGIVTFCKFYNCISHSELLLKVFLNMTGAFIIFFALGAGICSFLKQQIPQWGKRSIFTKQVSSKIDYVLPPDSLTSVGKSEKDETSSNETKASAETLAMAIRTVLAQE